MLTMQNIQNLIYGKQSVLDNLSTDDERFIEVNDDPNQYYSYNGQLTHTLCKHSLKVIVGTHKEYAAQSCVDVYRIYYK